ncbi:hypothetical protein LEP1GSC188_0293 [Leptospira weilii serovar Topaz str. LT2116]|uniref:Uncharacterized protein n=1 Tax=Leptospira weilii serovar Topaz str. LT2116 TaxID=1088540 RepID=M3G3G6_9LEPT|nr:hypothetical protein LEP1GSC188_0293 [Leptospira weilii serovar Topaz str. LT2116]
MSLTASPNVYPFFSCLFPFLPPSWKTLSITFYFSVVQSLA